CSPERPRAWGSSGSSSRRARPPAGRREPDIQRAIFGGVEAGRLEEPHLHGRVVRALDGDVVGLARIQRQVQLMVRVVEVYLQRNDTFSLGLGGCGLSNYDTRWRLERRGSMNIQAWNSTRVQRCVDPLRN